MATNPELSGSSARPIGRAPKQMPPGRECIEEGCFTRLSTYNRSDACFIHRPVRYPRTRGRNKSIREAASAA